MEFRKELYGSLENYILLSNNGDNLVYYDTNDTFMGIIPEEEYEKRDLVAVLTPEEERLTINIRNILNLQIKPHQFFIRNYLNPYVRKLKVPRILLFHQTGSGKTLSAIYVAKQFTQIMNTNDSVSTGPNRNIIILGFTRKNIKNEFIKYPALNFISRKEVLLLNRLKTQYGVASAVYTKLLSHLQKRITSSKYTGFYTFFGFKELINKLFSFKKSFFLRVKKTNTTTINTATNTKKKLPAQKKRGGAESVESAESEPDGPDESDEPELGDVDEEEDEEDEDEEDEEKINDITLLQFNRIELSIQQIYEGIRTKDIEVNYEVLALFKNTLIICDEFHNLYNSEHINNYGSVILFVLLELEKIPNNNTYFMALTATPLNNNPKEIVDCVNLLSATKVSEVQGYDVYLKNKNNVAELDAFISANLTGKVSVYRSAEHSVNYPKSIFCGVDHKGLPLLRFEPCAMSDFFFKNYIATVKMAPPNKFYYELNEYMFDDIFMPELATSEEEVNNKPASYKQKYRLFAIKEGIVHKKSTVAENDTTNTTRALKKNALRFYGDFFRRDNLQEYSPKYAALLDKLEVTKGKVFIYHKYIKKNGIKMLESILGINGYIGYDEVKIKESTLCLKCGLAHSAHTKIKSHVFIPARYMLITGESSEVDNERKKDLFNSFDNRDGSLCKILLGSRILEESSELNCVNDIFIVSVPINISIMQQIIGRVVRNNSHLYLPDDKRYVNIHLLVHTLTPAQEKIARKKFDVSSSVKCVYSNEESAYSIKIANHIHIEVLEGLLKKVSIDNILPYNDQSTVTTTTNNTNNTDERNAIYKRGSSIDLAKRVVNIHTKIQDFYFYGYINDIISFTIYFLKNLFVRYRVLSIKDILRYFFSNDYSMIFNTRMIPPNLIVYCLNRLLINTNVRDNIENFTNNFVIPGKRIIKVKDSYFLLDKDSLDISGGIISNDFLIKNQKTKDKSISIDEYISSYKRDSTDAYIKLRDSASNITEFLGLLDTREFHKDVIIQLLRKTKNKFVMNILPMFEKERERTNEFVGLIDRNFNFNIKDSTNEKTVSGIRCESYKKETIQRFINICIQRGPEKLKVLIENVDTLKIRSLCNVLKTLLFYLHTHSTTTTYFQITFLHLGKR
jgi:hypothetical protein